MGVGGSGEGVGGTAVGVAGSVGDGMIVGGGLKMSVGAFATRAEPEATTQKKTRSNVLLKRSLGLLDIILLL